MDFSLISIIAVLFTLFGAVAAKVVTMNLLEKMRRGIKEVHQQRQKAEIRLTATKAQKKFAVEKKLVLQTKRLKVEVKIEGLKRELEQMEEKDKKKKKEREARSPSVAYCNSIE